MDAISNQVRKLNAAMNAHDLNPIGDMYAEDAELVWPGLGAIKGRQAVVGFYARMLGSWDYYMRGRKHEIWDVATTTKKFEGDPLSLTER